MPILNGPNRLISITEQSRIIAAVKAGRGAACIASELGRSKKTVDIWIDKLRKRGAIK